jgi:hypothetical protein
MRGFGSRLLRAAGTMFLLSLPVGYIPETTDTADVMIGVHGGAGQVTSIIRDCSGNPVSTTQNGYVDVNGSAYYTRRIGDDVRLSLGASGGYWESDMLFASDVRYSVSGGVNDSARQTYSFSYVIPSIAIESKYVGAGVGIVLGDVPAEIGHRPEEDDYIPFSAHLRLGNYHKIYFMASLMENTPLISGGSLFDAGMGYHIGRSLHMYSGLSVGFYDQPGFIQQARIRLSQNLSLDVAGRFGIADDIVEGGLSAGLVYRIPLR